MYDLLMQRKPLSHRPARMFFLVLIAVAFAGAGSNPQSRPQRAGRIILLPMDDRPAVAQFAQMIGAIGDSEIVMPPDTMLGRFTRPGDARLIGDWLRRQDYSKTDAVVISVDMLCYGGLIASRSAKTTLEEANRRLELFRWLKKAHPRVPVYAFNVLMRVAPTADAASRPWRDDLARWSELSDQAPRTGDPALLSELSALKAKLDPSIIEDYLAARKRDLEIHLSMVELRRQKIVDALVFLQDDARVFGLHRKDQLAINEKIKSSGLEADVPIYNGADEGSLSLVSRAILEKFKQKIRVAVVFSSEKGKTIIAPYEDHPLQFTVESQISAAGATMVPERRSADYTLFVNAPGATESEFSEFRRELIDSLKAGQPACLADVLFPAPHYSGADERLMASIEAEALVDRFTGYAAWNTAGNTLGTAIPHANMRILAVKRFGSDPDQAARSLTAHLEFLLNRFSGDYLYHDIVRLQVNRELREDANTPTDEFTKEIYDRVSRDIGKRLRPLVEDFHARHFKGQTYNLNEKLPRHFLKIANLRDISIYLPWPRTFEVTLRYAMETQQMVAGQK